MRWRICLETGSVATGGDTEDAGADPAEEKEEEEEESDSPADCLAARTSALALALPLAALLVVELMVAERSRGVALSGCAEATSVAGVEDGVNAAAGLDA